MQVAFPAFRDGGARGASLVAYFEDARVTGWLALHGEEADSPFAAAAAWGRGLRSRIASLVPVTQVGCLTMCDPERKQNMAASCATFREETGRSNQRHRPPLLLVSFKQCGTAPF